MKTIFILLAFTFIIGCSSKKQDDPLSQITEVDITTPTVMCDMCEGTIKKAVFELEGVKGVDVDLDKKVAHIKYVAAQTNIETIEMAITNAGYDANSRKRNPDAYASLPDCCKND